MDRFEEKEDGRREDRRYNRLEDLGGKLEGMLLERATLEGRDLVV